MRKKYCGLVGCALFMVAAIAGAEIYQWEDEQGGIHFTDNADKIPAKYRKKVRQRDDLTPSAPQVRPPVVEAPAPAPRQVAPPSELLYGGQSAAWWKERFVVVRQELADAQQALNEKNAELQRAHRAYVVSLDTSRIKDPPENDNKDPKVKSFALNTIGAKRKAYYDLQAEIPQFEEKVKGAEVKLVALQAEADAAGVPPEAR